MKRIFHHYEKWEDWKDGLYRQSIEDADELMIRSAARVLADPSLLHRSMSSIIIRWPYSAEVNLSNRSRNRQAWLGQAACCFVCGANEDLTKQAWHRLSAAEQDAANAVADCVISRWEREQCQKLEQA